MESERKDSPQMKKSAVSFVAGPEGRRDPGGEEEFAERVPGREHAGGGGRALPGRTETEKDE